MTELTIDRLGQHGDGIAERHGVPVYVPLTLPGETVEATLDADRGALQAVLAASPDRAEPFCPYFGTCGGCALQHLALPAQLDFKRGLVEAALRRAGLSAPLLATVAAPGGRRRVTLHARGGRVGFMQRDSHDLVDIAACPILVPGLQTVAPQIVRAIHKALGADCDVALTDTGLIDVAIRSKRAPNSGALVALGRSVPRIGRIAVNGIMAHQPQPPSLTIGRAEVKLPVETFLQPTAAGEDVLAKLVLEALGTSRRVADLFCGIGTFSLRIAETARVLAIDGNRPAVEALQDAVRRASGLKPVTAEVHDLFREPISRFQLTDFDAVVFDPPRAGAEAQARELAASRVRTVVGVSCDPKTFARDAAILVAGGYTIERVTPVDQFAHSAHVELVGVFRR